MSIDEAALYRELGGINVKLSSIVEDVAEIKVQTTATNGRVTRHDAQIKALQDVNADERLDELEDERLVATGRRRQRDDTLRYRGVIIGAILGLFGGSGLLLLKTALEALTQ